MIHGPTPAEMTSTMVRCADRGQGERPENFGNQKSDDPKGSREDLTHENWDNSKLTYNESKVVKLVIFNVKLAVFYLLLIDHK